MCMYYKSVLINFFTGLTCKLNFAVFFMRCPILASFNCLTYHSKSFWQSASSVKRVWALHSALELMDMTNESSSLFFDLLQQTVVNNNYLGTEEVWTLLS